MLSSGAVGAVFLKELRGFLRDRHTVLYTVGLPALLYPAIFLGSVEVISYLRALEEREVARVAVAGERAADLVAFAETRAAAAEREGSEGSEGSEAGAASAAEPSLRVLPLPADRAVGDATDARGALGLDGGAAGDGEEPPDAVAVVRRTGALPGSDAERVAVDLYYTSADDRSASARGRAEALVSEWRRARIESLAREVGGDDELLRAVAIEEESLSTEEELANFVASLILPFLMTLMIAIGAFFPALEATVAEKERGTLETTLLAPVSRGAVVLGKYAAVTSMSLISFALNLAGMSFTLAHLSSQLPVGSFSISARGFAVASLGALLLAGLFGAIMMLLAFLAKSFKEGQAYLTPIYLLAMIPVVVSLNPEAELTLALAPVPIVSTTLLFRGALQGTLELAPTALALVTSLIWAMAALFLAGRVLSKEDVATGGDVAVLRALAGALRGKPVRKETVE